MKADPRGFEPLIFSVTGRRVNRATLWVLGVEGGSRTHDLGVMSATLLPTELPRHFKLIANC